MTMKLGEKAVLIIHPKYAYGDEGSPPSIPGGVTTIFVIELLEIKIPKKLARGIHDFMMGGN